MLYVGLGIPSESREDYSSLCAFEESTVLIVRPLVNLEDGIRYGNRDHRMVRSGSQTIVVKTYKSLRDSSMQSRPLIAVFVVDCSLAMKLVSNRSICQSS